MLRSSLLLLILLAGCDEQPTETKEVIRAKLSAEHYKISPRPKPKPKVEIEKEEPLVDYFFPDDDLDIIATRQAYNRLGEIRHRLHLANLETLNSSREEAGTKDIYFFEDEDYSRLNLKTDESSYPVNRDRILTKDMIIPAILETGINSQIAGRVTAMVYRDILSPTMRYVLLPAGTKIICDYAGLEQTGQTRLAINCHEIIRPDGSIVALSGMSGSDMSGKQALIGRVDNRVWQQYGGAFLVAGISALAQTSTQWTNSNTVNQASSGLSTELGKITSKVLEKNLDLRPVISINAATRIILKPLNNITFIKPTLVKKIINNRESKKT